MIWTIVIATVVILCASIVVIWGTRHLRGSIKDINTAVSNIKIEEIPDLANECVSVFRDDLNIKLSYDNLAEAARQLDSCANSEKVKTVFATPNLYWYFVKPMGAFLGQLIKYHNKEAKWEQIKPGQNQFIPEGGLKLVVPHKGQLHEIYPFHKIIKQHESGDKGDLELFIMVFAKSFPLSQSSQAEKK